MYSTGYIYDCKLVEKEERIFELIAYSSLFSGKDLYEFDNKDGHIKEIRDYSKDGNYDVIYLKE